MIIAILSYISVGIIVSGWITTIIIDIIRKIQISLQKKVKLNGKSG